MTPKPPTRRTFKVACQATPAIASAHQPGLQALAAVDKQRLMATEQATGSIALDDALRHRFPNDCRWDYGIGLPAGAGEQILWLEPHHSASKQAERVIKKLQWLRHWLRAEAPELNRMPAKFIWLLSNQEHPHDRRRRQQLAEKHGLQRRQGTLNLATLAGLH
jgi:hypothetical protein